MIGTGPFKFVEYVPQTRMVLERNETFWGMDAEGKGWLMRARLKLYVGDDGRQIAKNTRSDTAMPFGDFARVVADAVTWDRTWIQDFSDERVMVSQDLYEILRVYDDIQQTRA